MRLPVPAQTWNNRCMNPNARAEVTFLSTHQLHHGHVSTSHFVMVAAVKLRGQVPVNRLLAIGATAWIQSSSVEILHSTLICLTECAVHAVFFVRADLNNGCVTDFILRWKLIHVKGHPGNEIVCDSNVYTTHGGVQVAPVARSLAGMILSMWCGYDPIFIDGTFPQCWQS